MDGDIRQKGLWSPNPCPGVQWTFGFQFSVRNGSKNQAASINQYTVGYSLFRIILKDYSYSAWLSNYRREALGLRLIN